MSDFYKKLLILLSVITALLTLAVIFVYFSAPSIVSVDNAKIFQGFNMAKEMKGRGEKEYQYRQQRIDSLYKNLESGPSEDIKKEIVQQIISERESLDEFGQSFASAESSKIWSRIREYAAEYSRENNYDIIVGLQPDGNVHFAAEETDVTSDFINYINKKYEGYK